MSGASAGPDERPTLPSAVLSAHGGAKTRRRLANSWTLLFKQAVPKRPLNLYAPQSSVVAIYLTAIGRLDIPAYMN